MAGDNTVSLDNWDFNEQIVSSMKSRKFASAKTFLLAAGPPLHGDSSGLINPLGLVQQIGYSQQQQIMALFEVGSRERYLITGRTTNRLTLTRVMYSGRSLMNALYQNSGRAFPTDVPAHSQPAPNVASNLWWNLHSVVFEEPVGIYLEVNTFQNFTVVTPTDSLANPSPIGAIYLEECHIEGHQVNVDANNVLVAENVSLQWTRTVPVI